ncbi:F0F1 ATP synthase subunit B [Microvirga tunisiensis]|uniref:F0F1 ATP synthase subunit B n=2 Tax=Pannonibacter tanglangensis TaxID=2750084 RepID=A0ABW9ZI73_9HYPH|nr:MULTISPECIES: F0F1 ATP synthase subunit B [unclassified Pannonibacter]NBN64398.1 F0F1 ATP synthase subunit B [Pannonibacter sp. XCT-34]NBN78931.1 F0F1 ATP synthase subunit B [Pannonibacter sp. XCT-53]
MAGQAEPIPGQQVVDAHAAAHSAAFPPFDPTHFVSQLFWLAISFIVFYWIMKNVAVPRIAGILEDRRDRIAGDLAEAERLKRESDEASADYQKALTDARARARTIAGETRDKLKAETAARRDTAEQGIAAKLEEAEARIGQIKAQALSQVGEIASETSAVLVETLIGVTPSRADVDQAVKTAMN